MQLGDKKLLVQRASVGKRDGVMPLMPEPVVQLQVCKKREPESMNETEWPVMRPHVFEKRQN